MNLHGGPGCRMERWKPISSDGKMKGPGNMLKNSLHAPNFFMLPYLEKALVMTVPRRRANSDGSAGTSPSKIRA